MSGDPIGIFDSGIGGLTVMKQLIQLMPHENMIYFGDTARVPYGCKSPETILRYSHENTHFLLKHNIKLLVVACNTVSSLFLKDIGSGLSIPIIGVIQPSIKSIVKVSKNRKIGILATKATIQSGSYQKAILQSIPDAKIFAKACPLLVPLIEERLIEHPATKLLLQDYLQELLEENIDTLVLGCTHYPLLKPILEKLIVKPIDIIDPAITCAEYVKEILNCHKLKNSDSNIGKKHYFVSEDPQKFQLMGREFLGLPLDEVTLHQH